MTAVRVKPGYQITIPKEVREKVAIKVGEELDMFVDQKSELIIGKVPKSVVDASFGIWKKIKENGVSYVNRIRDNEEKRRKEMGIG